MLLDGRPVRPAAAVGPRLQERGVDRKRQLRLAKGLRGGHQLQRAVEQSRVEHRRATRAMLARAACRTVARQLAEGGGARG
eukprot:5183147-Prymnesium_polylepis.1